MRKFDFSCYLVSSHHILFHISFILRGIHARRVYDIEKEENRDHRHDYYYFRFKLVKCAKNKYINNNFKRLCYLFIIYYLWFYCFSFYHFIILPFYNFTILLFIYHSFINYFLFTLFFFVTRRIKDVNIDNLFFYFVYFYFLKMLKF